MAATFSSPRTLAFRVLNKMARMIHPTAGIIIGPVKHQPDPHIERILNANSGMFNMGHIYCADYAMKHLPSDAPMLEIGSFAGLSTNIWTYLKHKNGIPNQLITVDCWEWEKHYPPAPNGFPDYRTYRDFIKESFIRNAKFFSGKDLPYTIEMASRELFAAWRKAETVTDVFGRQIRLGGPLSFAYIDGEHGFDEVRSDFEGCDAFLEPGGFVLFDDSADGTGWGVCDFMEPMKRNAGYRLIARNPHYLFQKTK
jgi:hypothetical protein